MTMWRMIARIVVVLLAIGTMAIAGRVMTSEATHAAVERIAYRVERGLVVEPRFWTMLEIPAPKDDKTAYPCSGNAAQASFIAELAKIDSFEGTTDFALRDKSIAYAIERGENLLKCAPLDGATWFRLARLSIIADGLAPKTIEQFDMADKLAPSEGWLIGLRLPVYADLAQKGIPGFRARATRDIELFTAYGHSPTEALKWLKSWPTILRDGFLEGLKSVTLRERRWFATLAKADDIDIGQGTKGTVIIDPFTGKPFNADLDD